MPDFLAHAGVNLDFQFVFIFAMLVWIRLLAIVSTAPFLFGKPVPGTLRIGISVLLMLFAVPHLLPTVRPSIVDNWVLLSLLFLKEAMIGVVIGFVASLVFHAFEAAGDMVDNQRGMSIARVLIPQLGSQGSLVSQFLFQFSIVIYVSLGAHRLFFETLFHSFQTMPVLQFPSIAPGWLPLADLLIRTTGQLLSLSVTLAAPVIITVLVADIILGVANRVAPQINVWELGFTLKGYIGVLLLFFMITLMLPAMQHLFADSQQQIRRTVRLLEGGDDNAPPDVAPGSLPAAVPWLPRY